MASNRELAVVSSNLFGSLTPHEVEEEVKMISLLRQELRNTHEDHDGTSSAGPPVEPAFRTVDAKALRVLKFPSYPFVLCEGAPTTYQAPVPYNLKDVVAKLRERVQQLEAHLREEKAQLLSRRRCPSGAFGTGANNRRSIEGNEVLGEDLAQLFMEVMGRDACFADVSREASMVRWYIRWVVSHSLSCLQETQEQVEYVLAEDGMPSEADMDAAVRSISFVEAVSRLGKDRHRVIEAERRRMRSSTRTFREHLSPLTVTSATSSFLTAEEKYRYQEYYNQSEHVLMLLHHAAHVQYASQGMESSLVGQCTSLNTGVTRKQRSLSAAVRLSDAEDVRCLSDAAIKALREERDVIMVLLRNIHERQEDGVVIGVTSKEKRKSRLAAIAVYKCLLDDTAMLNELVHLGTQFLMDYDGWIQHYCGVDHEKVVQHLGAQAFLEVSSVNPPELTSRPNHSLMLLRDGPVPMTMSLFQAGQLPRHVEEVCETFMRILHDTNDVSSVESANRFGESAYRRWMCLSLRHLCMQVVRGRWLGDLLLAGIDDIASTLIRFVAEYNSNLGAAHSHVTELNAVLRCFLSLVADGTAAQKAHREVSVPVGGNNNNSSSSSTAFIPSTSPSPRSLDIPVAVRLEEDVESPKRILFASDEDENIWGAIFDALWFQADPTGCSHGGFLISKDLVIDAKRGFGFLRLESITLPERLPKETLQSNRRPTLLYLNLHYAIQLADMSPARSLAQVMDDNLSAMASTSVTTRCGYTRRVLYILSILEQAQLLQDYACRLQEVELVPFENAFYFARQRDDSRLTNSAAVHPYTTVSQSGDDASIGRHKYMTVVGLLPPTAVHLLRYNAVLPGTRYAVSQNESPSVISIALLIGNMLLAIASRGDPLLDGMYLMGETVREQGMWEAENGNDKLNMRGTLDADWRYERSDEEKRKALLVLPLLRTLDEYISSAAFDKILEQADREMRQRSQSRSAPRDPRTNSTSTGLTPLGQRRR